LFTAGGRLGGTGLSNVASMRHGHCTARQPAKSDRLRQPSVGVPNDLIKTIWFQPARFLVVSSRYYYSMKRMWLDRRVASYLRSNKCDIFHGWTHESLHSLQAAKQQGAITSSIAAIRTRASASASSTRICHLRRTAQAEQAPRG